MKLAFRIALRFLTSSKGQTVLIAMGIAIGISVQIFIGSLIEGLQISLLDSTIGSSSQITISAKEKNAAIDDYSDITNKITADYPQVTEIASNLSQGAFIKTEDQTTQVLLRGFELEKADGIYGLKDALVSGDKLPATDSNEVIIGVDIAKDYNLDIGNTIELITPAGEMYEALIIGTFDLKVASINQSWVISSLEYAQEVFSFETNQVTGIEMQVEEPFDVDLIAEDMTASLDNESIVVDNWKIQNESLLSGLSGQSTSSLMIQIFVVISVVLGIASVLAITVLQKSRQIGILKAMGINDKTSSLVFLFQGFILGILGGILGIIFGIGLLYVFSTFALNADGTPVVPIFINYGFIGLSGMIAVTASTLASIIPALKSRKLSPIEVIKNG